MKKNSKSSFAQLDRIDAQAQFHRKIINALLNNIYQVSPQYSN